MYTIYIYLLRRLKVLAEVYIILGCLSMFIAGGLLVDVARSLLHSLFKVTQTNYCT